MSNDRSILERQIERVELEPFTLERFHHRRKAKQRNRRIAAVVVALVVAAAGFSGLIRTFSPGLVPAGDPRNPFLGEWTATGLGTGECNGTDVTKNCGAQSMAISPGDDGTLRIEVSDHVSDRCTNSPLMITGAARIENPTTLVVPSAAITCSTGKTSPASTSLRLVLDQASDRLFDETGTSWLRRATVGTATIGDVTIPDQPETGPRSFLGGEIALHIETPWRDHVESYLDPRLFFVLDPHDAWIEFVANPLPEASCNGVQTVPASADELLRDIRSNPDLETTEPVAASIGGIDAQRLDVSPVPGAESCPRVPIVTVSGRESWGSIEEGNRARVYVLDLPGGSARALAILITAEEPVFEETLRAAEPILDSISFQSAGHPEG